MGLSVRTEGEKSPKSENLGLNAEAELFAKTSLRSRPHGSSWSAEPAQPLRLSGRI